MDTFSEHVGFIIYSLTNTKMPFIFMLWGDSLDPNINSGEEMDYMIARVKTVVVKGDPARLHCVAHVQNNLDFAGREVSGQYEDPHP